MSYTNMKKRRFTLMELLVVITIILLLAGLVGPRILGVGDKAKRDAAATQIKLLRKTVEQYYLDKSQYPDSLEGLLEKDAYGNRYFSEEYIPQDPWGNEYIYQKPGSGDRPFDIISYCRDGNAGGEGIDSDISCWDNPNKKNK